MKEIIFMTAIGTGFMLLMTSLGAAVVLLFGKKEVNQSLRRFMLGFSAGVMIAASIWSMIIPALSASEGITKVIPVALGIFCGAGFITVTDALITKYRFGLSEGNELDEKKKRNSLLCLAVTLHNIPEGMAVGLSFAIAAQAGGDYAVALALAFCIGVQNFPEGAAISLPLYRDGIGSKKAVLIGCLTGAVEPPAGFIAIAAVSIAEPIMPYLLSFAAGAMIYVTAEELIPEAHGGKKSGTLGFVSGFILMLIFDVALG